MGAKAFGARRDSVQWENETGTTAPVDSDTLVLFFSFSRNGFLHPLFFCVRLRVKSQKRLYRPLSASMIWNV